MERSAKARNRQVSERNPHRNAPRRDVAEKARGQRELTGPARLETSPPGADALQRYMTELHGLSLLDGAQEKALAREIEQLEIEHWCALLSYRPALDVIHATVAPRLPERARKLELLLRSSAPLRVRRSGAKRSAGWPPPLAAAAAQLRALDVERSALSSANEAVQASFAEHAGAQPYLARVARAREAQQRAKARFVAANLRLVIAMARRHGNRLLPLADLIQEGNLGLMRAVERFDYRRGYRFSTYAAWWIRHHFNRASADTARLVRVPVHALDALSRAARANRLNAAKTGADLSDEELAEYMGLSEEKLSQLRAAGYRKQPVSLDSQVRDDREQTLHETLPAPCQGEPEEALDLAGWREAVPQLLAKLPPMEAAILRFRFGLDDGEELTLREVGQKYNLSRERIRQLQELALGKLREALAARPQLEDEDAAARSEATAASAA